jgi:hypothetical protein
VGSHDAVFSPALGTDVTHYDQAGIDGDPHFQQGEAIGLIQAIDLLHGAKVRIYSPEYVYELAI